jgi:hypothetical protein
VDADVDVAVFTVVVPLCPQMPEANDPAQ